MIILFFTLSIFMATMRNILLKNLSDIRYGTKSFYLMQTIIFGCGGLILMLSGVSFAGVSVVTVICSVIYGLCLIIAQYGYTFALKSGKVGLCSTIYSLGFVFPTLSGRIIWDEKLNLYNILGIVLVIPILIITGRKQSNKEKQKNNGFIFPLITAMLASGGLGIIQKAHQNSEYSEQKSVFLVFAFCLASLISFGFSMSKNREKVRLVTKNRVFSAIGTGVAFSISNLLNTILAGKLSSVVFFPGLNIGTIIFSLILSIIIYKEKCTKRELLVLFMGFLSIILISR